MPYRRLHRAADIRAVFAARQVVHGPAAAVHWLAGPEAAGEPPVRAAVVAGRKVGGAVQRNRAKRRLRAVLQASASAVRLPLDVVVVARPSAGTVPFGELLAEVDGALAKAARRAAARQDGPRDAVPYPVPSAGRPA